jgi:tetratricopeptide (TPR) repeat protein
MAEFFLHDLATAEAEFRKAISMSSEKYGDAFVALASVLEGSNRMAEAEQSARKGVELSPESWQGHLELARALLAENRTVEAEDSATKARALKPDYADTYITLANIHIRLNDTSALFADVTTYLKLAPTGPYSARAREIQQSLSRQNQGQHGSG